MLRARRKHRAQHQYIAWLALWQQRHRLKSVNALLSDNGSIAIVKWRQSISSAISSGGGNIKRSRGAQ